MLSSRIRVVYCLLLSPLISNVIFLLIQKEYKKLWDNEIIGKPICQGNLNKAKVPLFTYPGLRLI